MEQREDTIEIDLTELEPLEDAERQWLSRKPTVEYPRPVQLQLAAWLRPYYTASVLLFFLGACALDTRDPTPRERMVIDQTFLEWTRDSTINQNPTQCLERLDNIGIAVLACDEFEDVCKRACPSRASETVQAAAGCTWLGDIIIAEELILRRLDYFSVVSHETIHNLGACAKQPKSGGHTDPRLWGAEGVYGRTKDWIISWIDDGSPIVRKD